MALHRCFVRPPSLSTLAISLLFISSCIAAQSTAPSSPSFEVASIKLDNSASPVPGVHFPLGRFVATTNAVTLIAFAYDLKNPAAQISGGPNWIRTELFDIDAKVESTPTEQEKTPLGQRVDQARPMVEALLAGRFKLKVSHQTKMLPVYVLVLAKNGPKFAEDNSHPEIGAVSLHGPGSLSATSTPFGVFSSVLSRMPELEGRLVMDKTGLRGNYTFTLKWTPENLASGHAQSRENTGALDSSGPSLFTALQEQLGLKLENSQSPQDVVVVEHIEQPTPN